MGRTYSIDQISARLQSTVDEGRPIIGASASSGLVATAVEAGGADFIALYSTGLSRVMGLETRLIGDANSVTFAMHEEVWAVTQDIPIIVGLDANDPFNWDLEKLVDRFVAIGASGVIHNPMVGIYGSDYAAMRNQIGAGFDREISLTEVARSRGLYCLAYTWTVEETLALTRAGTHCIIAHVGGTGGGLEPIPHRTVEECMPIINDIMAAAKSVDPEVVVLAHGGPFTDPESVTALYEHTEVAGYIGASSIERTPVESAVMEATRALKAVRIEARV